MLFFSCLRHEHMRIFSCKKKQLGWSPNPILAFHWRQEMVTLKAPGKGEHDLHQPRMVGEELRCFSANNKGNFSRTYDRHQPKYGLVERMIMQIVFHMMLEVMWYLLDKETSTYCKSQKKLTAMVSLWKIRMPDNHESIYFVNTSYIIADTTGERWFKFPTYCWLCWVSVGAESFEVFNVHDDAAISVFGRSVFVSKFCQGVHFRLTKHEPTSMEKWQF